MDEQHSAAGADRIENMMQIKVHENWRLPCRGDFAPYREEGERYLRRTGQAEGYRTEDGSDDFVVKCVVADMPGEPLWDFYFDRDNPSRSYFTLNTRAWTKMAGVPDEAAKNLAGAELDSFAKIHYSWWNSTSTSFEDPGDGGEKVEVYELPSDSALRNDLEDIIEYSDDISVDDGVKLMDVFGEMSTALDKEYSEYVDDSNW